MKKSKKRPAWLLFLFTFLLVFIISLFVILISLMQPVDTSDQTTKTFVIPQGQSTQRIAERLKEEGLIRSTLAFRLVVFQQDMQKSIQAGSFKLQPSLSVSDLIKILSKGTDDLWITIPEGWRREEIAASLAKQGLINFNDQEFFTLTANLEGQLFPETYLVSKASTTQAIVNLLHNTFENKVLNSLGEDLDTNQLNLEQILTLASLVQRESANDEEMPLVAGILFNRLKINMPLQVDASLQYIKAYSSAEQSWWSTPTAADRNLNSAYNTYQNSGLPPAPICNPGLAAIKAVLNPQTTTALYYIHDLSGQIHIAETLDAHNNNVNRYLR